MAVEMDAPGRPGIKPTWSSSAKDLVTTALGASRLWATVGHGILNEVYWPSTGHPQTRDLGFIVAGEGLWYELKRVNDYTLSTPEDYIPLPKVTHQGEGYTLELEFLPDTWRDVLLIHYALKGEGFKLYPLLAPHLGLNIHDNTAWVKHGTYLYATGGNDALCLVSDSGFSRASAGFVGASDGWQDFAQNGRMTWEYECAARGNVALLGELPSSEGVLALGFANETAGAKTLVYSSLTEGYKVVRRNFVEAWEEWGKNLDFPKSSAAIKKEAYLSAVTLKVHEDRHFPGAVVASLSTPWGNVHSDPGGYHLVWARDAVEAGLGLLAAGQPEDARRMLAYLMATQHRDGHWAQNFQPNSVTYWKGIQLDEVGFPILLLAKLKELGALGELSPSESKRMVELAAAYLVKYGPVSPQDRWEENPGINPFTHAVVVAALVAATPFLEKEERAYVLSLADCWNEQTELWTYAQGTDLARKHGVDGYYVRIAPPPTQGDLDTQIMLKNRQGQTIAAHDLISTGFFYLARLGLRKADDPHIKNSLKVAEALLEAETPSGPGFHRYNEDGYGEHADGSPFDGHGIGRLWPLLVGERGLLAVQLGEDLKSYLKTMATMTGPGGLIPEQVWDADPIPEKELFPGKPSGSAMPLVWAHAEFLKLLMAAQTGQPLLRLDSVWQRYGGEIPQAAPWHWRQSAPWSALPRAARCSSRRTGPSPCTRARTAGGTCATTPPSP